MANWIAINHVGKFRKGHVYTSAQLGVLGRMAVYSGHLIPHVETLPSGRKKAASAAPKKLSQNQRRKRGWADGEAVVQAGGSEELRDDPGA